MNGTVTRRSLEEAGTGRSDWERVERLTDAEIDASVVADPDAAPVVDADWFAEAELVMPERKQAVSLRIDADVLQWYKAQGPGYLSRMNAVLRQYAISQGAVLTGRPVRVRKAG